MENEATRTASNHRTHDDAADLTTLERAQIERMIATAASEQRTWSLFATGLVALHVVQFVALAVPWAEDGAVTGLDTVRSGLSLVGTGDSVGGLLGLSLVVLGVSAWITLAGLRSRSSGAMTAVIVVAIARVGLLGMAASITTDDGLDRHLRYGISISVIVAIAIAVCAATAARHFRSVT
ncbi:MAG: hypothetical protein ABJH68_09605 [Ilumatobacter sp.]|uniref:hypothetical protein n=1 Tax=Ilumatobacter sp. TaxID=1967498 RepID=UPI0032989B30